MNRTAAICARCRAERLWMGTHDGRLLEACPVCDWGWPVSSPKPRRVCENCSASLAGEADQWTRCKDCRSKERKLPACQDCGAPCRRDRCARCREKAQQRRDAAEQARKAGYFAARKRELQARAAARDSQCVAKSRRSTGLRGHTSTSLNLACDHRNPLSCDKENTAYTPNEAA